MDNSHLRLKIVYNGSDYSQNELLVTELVNAQSNLVQETFTNQWSRNIASVKLKCNQCANYKNGQYILRYKLNEIQYQMLIEAVDTDDYGYVIVVACVIGAVMIVGSISASVLGVIRVQRQIKQMKKKRNNVNV
ncbi:Hypothetical_protein [Hexamita inflata]|uniref:Hypothetical_protein n=1 Tax=Hexamita inflata TaxID=28002 RepID=A0AA86TV83_9EUKA|nr:Hypothetical protein HINF_LOCUS16052 [Hexamita inflata]